MTDNNNLNYKTLIIEVMEGIALLKINRPESLNALNAEVFSELSECIDKINANAEVKGLIVTGSGEKSFVAGADIKEMLNTNLLGGQAFSRRGQSIFEKLSSSPKPIIAAVNGFALGAGLELALSCDFIYASVNAKLGLPEATLGIIPGYGGTQNLTRIIGAQKTSELIFTGKMLTATEAKDWGIVNAVFAKEELLTKTQETLKAIIKNGPLAVAAAKDAIRNGFNMSKSDALKYESVHFGYLFNTEDRVEGMRAFAEKRKVEFKGK
ncbi:MAG: enoyl-CoA hydratase/isomerase family protein [Oligoflexia bacterium]|nr:enoyl-CoA hydratase/isomerase family protein [Oligoflexia bacterium]